MLEAPPGAVRGAPGGVQPPVATPDRRDRVRARHPVMAQGQSRVPLACVPGRMLIAQGQHRMLHDSRRSTRRRLGATRSIQEPSPPLHYDSQLEHAVAPGRVVEAPPPTPRWHRGGGAGRWTLAARRWACKQISCLASAQSMPMKAPRSLPP
jgi:hypothetical protein